MAPRRVDRGGQSAATTGAVACVLGDLDLIRPLALAGISSVVVAAAGSPARHSRHVAAALEPPDDWERPDGFVDRLVRFGRGQPERPVLYFQEDLQLLFVSRHREQLAQGFRFVLPDATRIEELVDKASFARLACRLQLPVPMTSVLRPTGSAPPPDLAFPLLIKPLFRDHLVWRSLSPGSKAVRIDERSHLEAMWPRLVAAGGAVLAQEVIPGPETLVESYHSYVDREGRIVAEFTGRKVRTLPREYGRTTALTLTDEPDVKQVGRRVIEALELVGVSKLDFKRTPDGTLRLLEVNPRFNLWHHPAAVAGLNVPALVHADATGRPRPPVDAPRPHLRWASEGDVVAARAWGVPWPRWFRWFLRCETKHVWSWRDPVPFVHLALTQVRGSPAAARGPFPTRTTRRRAAVRGGR